MEQKKVYSVICQKWEESERGWGRRPHGYSLHLTDADRKRFIKEYWDGMPDRDEYGNAPDEYSLPNGTPYPCEVSEEIWRAVKERASGMRFWGSAPYPGGVDGWDAGNYEALPRLADVHCVKCFKTPCKCRKSNA